MTGCEPDPVQRRAQLKITVIGTGATLVLGLLFVFGMKWVRSLEPDRWVINLLILTFMAIVLTISSVMSRASARVSGVRPSTASKRYGTRVGSAVTIYALVYVMVVNIDHNSPIQGPWAWVLGVAPALPLLGVLAAMALYLKEETDEFQRNLVLESTLWASLVLIGVATMWGFLQEFHLVAPPPVWAALPAWAVLMAVARMLILRRYR